MKSPTTYVALALFTLGLLPVPTLAGESQHGRVDAGKETRPPARKIVISFRSGPFVNNTGGRQAYTIPRYADEYFSKPYTINSMRHTRSLLFSR